MSDPTRPMTSEEALASVKKAYADLQKQAAPGEYMKITPEQRSAILRANAAGESVVMMTDEEIKAYADQRGAGGQCPLTSDEIEEVRKEVWADKGGPRQADMDRQRGGCEPGEELAYGLRQETGSHRLEAPESAMRIEALRAAMKAAELFGVPIESPVRSILDLADHFLKWLEGK